MYIYKCNKCSKYRRQDAQKIKKIQQQKCIVLRTIKGLFLSTKKSVSFVLELIIHRHTGRGTYLLVVVISVVYRKLQESKIILVHPYLMHIRCWCKTDHQCYQYFDSISRLISFTPYLCSDRSSIQLCDINCCLFNHFA